jgi:hypothetical protein
MGIEKINNEQGIFISYIHEEETLANYLKELLGEYFNINNIFLSKDILPGRNWYQEIREALNRCKVTISLFSDASFSRPWINLEAGATLIKIENTLIPVCHSGFNSDNLIRTIGQIEAIKSIEQEDDLRKLIKSVGKVFKSDYECPIEGGDFRRNILEKIRNFEEINKMIVHLSNNDCFATTGTDISHGYPFDFIGMINRAKKDILLSGQNLHFLLGKDPDTQETYKDKIFEFLNDKDKCVRILVCGLEYDYAIQTWEETMRTEGQGLYKGNLTEVIQKFKEWLIEIKSSTIVKGVLEIKTTVFVPVSMTFTDTSPNDPNSICVLIPNVYAQIPQRPYYVITKNKHQQTYDKYWHSISNTWEHYAKPL